ncbi:MAG: ABC transporter substrate-binding protein, partial [Dehalococcoidales bacterium]
MRYKGSLKITLAIVITLAISMIPLLSSGCADAGAPAPSGVKVGFSICYTGVAAEKGRPMGNAKLDCIKFINDELGGVAGNPIEVVWRDNEYDAAKAVTIINELMNEDCLFFTTNSSKMMAASMEIANRASFPGFTVFSSP